jgi:hypothetical protein
MAQATADMSHHDGERCDWMLAATCASLQEAQVLKSVLAADGIDSRLPDEYTLGVQPVASVLGGARLLVPAGDFDRAQELLRFPRTS